MMISVILIEEIDLLIIDEAGQILPGVVGATLALAKQAVFFGDRQQLEPIVKVPPMIDFCNAQKKGVIPEESEIR